MLIRKMAFLGLYIFMGLLFVTSAMAADRANFTGTWIRDANRSDSYTAVTDSRSKLPDNVNYTLRIEQSGKRLLIHVEQNGQSIDSFVLTQWKRSLPLGFGSKGLNMRWFGDDTLRIEKFSVVHGNLRDRRDESTQDWVLSQGGEVLTITTTTLENSRMLVTKEVFNGK